MEFPKQKYENDTYIALNTEPIIRKFYNYKKIVLILYTFTSKATQVNIKARTVHQEIAAKAKNVKKNANERIFR